MLGLFLVDFHATNIVLLPTRGRLMTQKSAKVSITARVSLAAGLQMFKNSHSQLSIMY